MMMKRFLLCAALGCTLAAVPAVAQDLPSLTIKCKDAKAPGSGILETDSYAVNNAGVLAGDYVDANGVQHGMLLLKKNLTSFDGPAGSSGIAAYGVNSNNVAVGWYVDSNGVNQGFKYDNGTMSSVFFPKSIGTQANGINDNGWIVGSYVDTNGVTHGFYWDTKKYRKLDVKGALSTQVWAINNSNVMSLYTTDTSSGLPLDGYTYAAKKFTVVDPPGSAGTALHGINNNGDLDYTIFDSSQNRHGVLYQASTGVFTQFDDPNGANTTRADGINDSDTMDGRYSPSSGNPPSAGFVCTVK